MLSKLFSWAQGRSTTFAGAFFITGTVLAFMRRLDMTYVAFMGTLMGAVVGHSIKEDWFAAKSTQQNGGDNANTE